MDIVALATTHIISIRLDLLFLLCLRLLFSLYGVCRARLSTTFSSSTSPHRRRHFPRAADLMPCRREDALLRTGGGHHHLLAAAVLVGHVAVAAAGAGLGEGEAQLADEARGQAARLDELQEDGDRRAHVARGHQGRRVEFRQGLQVRLGEALTQGHTSPLLRFCAVREGVVPWRSKTESEAL